MFNTVYIMQPPVYIGWIGAVVWFVVKMVALIAVSRWLTPSSSSQQTTKPSVDSVDFPTAEEGRPHPVLFGTKRLRGSNVTWWGKVEITAITS